MKKLLTLLCFTFLCLTCLQAQFFASTSPANCFGACSGSSQILPTGNYHYTWNTGNSGDTMQSVNSLCPGQYTCRIFDSAYHYLDSVLVLVNVSPPIFIATSATASSCGANDGSIVASVQGGSPPYMYTWSPGVATAAVVQGAAPGVYCLTVTDGNGCSASTCDTVQQTGASVSISSLVPPGCNACDGSANLSITGGLQPYTYLWNGFDTSSHPTLCAGLNSVVVTDATHCSGTIQFLLSNNSGMSATAINTNVSCLHPVDTTTVSVTGGSHLLNFYWGDNSNPDIGVTSPQKHAYAHPGIYIIEVVDSSGCAFFMNDTVLNNAVVVRIDSLANPYCNNLNAGVLHAVATGGTGPYTYLWNTGAGSDSLVHIAAGNYAVTVTDHVGCTGSIATSLSQSGGEPGFYVYATSSPVNCNSGNGASIANAFGGQLPYSYLWSTGQTTQAINNLSAATYTVTVTDANGCIATGYGYVGLSCYSYITGNVYVDANNNCVRDSGEIGVTSIIMAAGSSGNYYGYAYGNGNYSILVPDTGTYTINASSYSSYCNDLVLCGNASQTVSIHHMGDSSNNNNFGYQGNMGFDLALHPGWTSVNPGFTKEYWVMGFNQSPVPFTGTATIVFTYDSNLIYQSSYAPIPVHNPAAHTLTWLVSDSDLPSPIFNFSNRFRNFFTVPATMSPGYLIQSSFSISPMSGDCDSSNNVLYFSETCTGSHDPNSKRVEPAGDIIESDSVLTYTIDFQNTGTAATNFIIIKDTLSPNLDPASVVNIASSAPYSKFDISGKGILTWTFNPLVLPDSLADPEGSKGFVKFAVKKKANLAMGSSISNTASIYFDYNTGVVTNTVSDTLTAPLAVIERYSDPSVSVRAYPNPFSDVTNIVVTGLSESFGFELYDVMGRKVQTIPMVGKDQFQVHRDGLAGGVYLYRITIRGDQRAYGKLIAE